MKIRSICVDTLTALQTKQWMRDSKKPGFDEWFDFGKDIYNFMDDLINKGFELILILGEPGTGKSSGLRTLPAGSNIWFNADAKNPTWTGGKEIYGGKNTPTPKIHIIPTSYDDMTTIVDRVLAAGAFEDERFAFITAHTDSYKVGVQSRERLKTLGKVATKMQLEGRAETVLYSRVEKQGSKTNFILETQNDGYNTARSPQGMFEGKIPNDYNFIINKLLGVPTGEPIS